MEFGEQIRKLRTDNHLSQEQFGEQLHVTRQAVSNRENNKNLPDLIHMSRIFHVSLDELIMGGNEDMNNMTQKLIKDGRDKKSEGQYGQYLNRNLPSCHGLLLLLCQGKQCGVYRQ
ncbi:MAG: helix-turn-helix transcriptional regulator [Bulleidia sp.]|nr:helix-turn-helix transcriptional regulator [Bulleidia sp.]